MKGTEKNAQEMDDLLQPGLDYVDVHFGCFFWEPPSLSSLPVDENHYITTQFYMGSAVSTWTIWIQAQIAQPIY